MKAISPFSNTVFTYLLIALTGAAFLVSKANQHWGDTELVYFMIMMSFAVATLGFRIASACERFQQILIPVGIVSAPFLAFILMSQIIHESNMIISAGIAVGWTVCLLSVIYGALVSYTESTVNA